MRVRTLLSGDTRVRTLLITWVRSSGHRSISECFVRCASSAGLSHLFVLLSGAHADLWCSCCSLVLSPQWRSYPAEKQQAILLATHMRRLGTPSDIASAALFFGSEMASWITGQVLEVNGGN
jgi:hypothetical protein